MTARKPRKHKYPSDTENGIRTITQIRALPSGQLTDSEFVKEFFDRFEAKVLLVQYVDQEDQIQCFGRLKYGAKNTEFYDELVRQFQIMWQLSVNEIRTESNQATNK